MGVISKPQARIKDLDRISALPDEVLSHILSFLPTLDAVRTSLLSKIWKNIWTSLPNLDFDDTRDFNTDKKGCYDSDLFTTFVDYVLFFRDSSDIKKLSLLICCPQDLSRIHEWICTAVRRNVVELDLYLRFEGGCTFEIPQSLFMCKTLKLLRVATGYNSIICDPPTSRCFPSLKFLHISAFSPEVDSITKLIFNCPVLEELIIDGDIEYGGFRNFNVSAPELKTLRIDLNVIDGHKASKP